MHLPEQLIENFSNFFEYFNISSPHTSILEEQNVKLFIDKSEEFFKLKDIFDKEGEKVFRRFENFHIALAGLDKLSRKVENPRGSIRSIRRVSFFHGLQNTFLIFNLSQKLLPTMRMMVMMTRMKRQWRRSMNLQGRRFKTIKTTRA